MNVKLALVLNVTVRYVNSKGTAVETKVFMPNSVGLPINYGFSSATTTFFSLTDMLKFAEYEGLTSNSSFMESINKDKKINSAEWI